MHVVFRESRGLEETATPRDIGQDPAGLVVLSFSDSDLAAFAAGWRRGRDSLPSLRLANLAELRHPLSVDTYVERTLSQARGILVRLIGGESYWAYGLAALHQLAKDRNIALAVLPADGRDDTRLDAYSTLPVSTLRRLMVLCDTGGPVAAQAAIAQLALASGLYAGPVVGEMTVPEMGFYDPARGVIVAPSDGDGRPRALVTFYRSYLAAADTGPVDALIAALREKGFHAYGVFVTSLKAVGVADWLRAYLAQNPPAAIVNATAFSAMGDDGTTPFDAAPCPVFQVALSTARREDWAASLRGLSPGDLAMHVVLPEIDGRLFAGVVSFKSAADRDPDLQFSHLAHRPDAERVTAVAARVAAWRLLAEKPASEKRLAIVLSNYPGRPHQIAHAVGLDALASVEAFVSDLGEAGFDVEPVRALGESLPRQHLAWSIADYRVALSRLPPALQEGLAQAWGRQRAIRVAATAHSNSPRSNAADRSSRFSPSAARGLRAPPIITISPARRAMPMSRSICGSARRRLTLSCTWARTARWNGCRVNPLRCHRAAGRKPWPAICRSSILSSSTIPARPRRPSGGSLPSRSVTCRRRSQHPRSLKACAGSNSSSTNIRPLMVLIPPDASA